MKKLVCGLNSGYDDWQAMLPTSFKPGSDLVQILENGTWKPKIWECNEVIPFILVGKRTWDLSTEEKEELGHNGFKQKYPFGKPLHQPGTKGEEFRDILYWGANPMIEHTVFENPDNGGSGVFRIVSPKLKEVLEQFQLPPHRFYPAEVTHEITGEKRPYYLFHVTNESGNYLDNIYWPMVEVAIAKKGEFDYNNMASGKLENVKTYERGSLKDSKDFQKKYNDFTKQLAGIPEDKVLDLNNDEDYEIWWEKLSMFEAKYLNYVYLDQLDLIGFGTEIIISNELKKALDESFSGKNLHLNNENMVDVITGYKPGEELPL